MCLCCVGAGTKRPRDYAQTQLCFGTDTRAPWLHSIAQGEHHLDIGESLAVAQLLSLGEGEGQRERDHEGDGERGRGREDDSNGEGKEHDEGEEKGRLGREGDLEGQGDDEGVGEGHGEGQDEQDGQRGHFKSVMSTFAPMLSKGLMDAFFVKGTKDKFVSSLSPFPWRSRSRMRLSDLSPLICL